MIISVFEIHLKPPLSQSIPIPLGSFVRNVRANSRRKSFVRSRYRIRTAHPYRIRYLNDTSVPPLLTISRYPSSMQSTWMRILCKYSRDCKPRSNTDYDNTSTKHRVYRCIIAGTYTRTGGAYPRKAIEERYRPLLYTRACKLHVTNAYSSRSFICTKVISFSRDNFILIFLINCVLLFYPSIIDHTII